MDDSNRRSLESDDPAEKNERLRDRMLRKDRHYDPGEMFGPVTGCWMNGRRNVEVTVT